MKTYQQKTSNESVFNENNVVGVEMLRRRDVDVV